MLPTLPEAGGTVQKAVRSLQSLTARQDAHADRQETLTTQCMLAPLPLTSHTQDSAAVFYKPVEDRCFRNPPCEVRGPRNHADDFSVTCHTGVLMWTEHRRYCQTQYGSMTEHRVFAHSCLTPTAFCTEANSILSNFLCRYNALYSTALQRSLVTNE